MKADNQNYKDSNKANFLTHKITETDTLWASIGG